MKQRPTLASRQTVQSKLILALSVVGGGILLMGLIFGVNMASKKDMPGHGVDKVYTFVASEDNYYENPNNWEPSYPGNIIQKGDRVVIQKDVHFTGYDLEVMGELHVHLEATLFSSEGKIRIGDHAKISNDGTIILAEIENRGKIDNNFSATINLHSYRSHEKATTTNSPSASFIILGDVVNAGKFDNYSFCSIGNRFENTAVFNQMHASELIVKGEKVEVAN